MQQAITPQFIEIPYQSPQLVFAKLAKQSWAVLLESASAHAETGKFSFIGIDPFLKIISKQNDIWVNNNKRTGHPLLVLKELLAEFNIQKHPDLPPFQGGAVGYFGYELAHHIESLPANNDDMNFADMMLGFYDLVIAFDHSKQRSFIFSSGLPCKDLQAQKFYAEQRLLWLQQQLENEIADISRTFSLKTDVTANFSRNQYTELVTSALEHIYSGDIFQVNLSQRFNAILNEPIDPFALYRCLAEINAAPFAAYLKFDDTIIISASPERFLKLENKRVETRPIKGTAKRSMNSDEDQAAALSLLSSEKNRAENTMIVDLLRNDLSRVCLPHSVVTTKLCDIESYATVHHLVSVIVGELMPLCDAIDLLLACFPGGSITGAPKVRAMEIIAELEPTQRGPYCGALGYLGFDGDMDLAITIRTFLIKNNQLSFQVGGGIVADSNVEQEYEETLLKAQALMQSLM